MSFQKTQKVIILMIAFFSFTSISFQSNAQKYAIGFTAGGSSYIGDLSNNFQLEATKTAFGAWFKYNYNPYWGIRAGFLRGTVGAADSLSTIDWRKNRNLSFQSEFNEFNAKIEFHFFKFIPNSRDYRYTPYIHTGISVFRFNPTAEYLGQTVELQGLGTEGQSYVGTDGNVPYALTSVAIPFGAGFKVNVSGFHSLGIEFGSRLTFTDYLDDVSKTYGDFDQILDNNGPVAAALSDRSPELGLFNNEPGKMRGNEAFNDWYFYLGLTYIYTFKSSDCPNFK